ncbi:MAG: signal peptidase II [Chloroflexi bacterium]|nr:signal peptidase II [Chloroflexota bacterium]
MFSRRTLTFAATALSVIALDRWTKQLAIDHLLESGVRSIPLLGDIVKLTYVENRGAAFGVLQNQTAFFVLVGVIVISVIIASYRYIPEPSWILNLCLGLQMGGAIGNLIDRIQVGYVVDFIDFTYWPVFNIADSAICVGVAGLAYSVLFPPRRHLHDHAPDPRASDA